MPSVTFRLKEPNGQKLTLIYLFFRANNLEVKYSTSQRVSPKFWNIEKQRAKETRQYPQYSELNNLLTDLYNCIISAYRACLISKIKPTSELLKKELNVFLQKEVKSDYNLITFGEYIAEKTDRKPGTIKQHKQTVRLLREFSQARNCELSFEAIDLNFYDSFLEFLTQKGYARNSIGSHIKNIKLFMNEAFDRKLTINVQYKNKRFKKLEEASDSIYLTQSEIQKIYEHDFTSNSSLEKVRDMFVIACYTGLRFSDLVKLKSENIIKDGTQIKLTTQKTGELIAVPIKSTVRSIFHKYEGKLPSMISNQKMNECLKEIGKIAKIESPVNMSITKGGKRQSENYQKFELITTHTARRSFATNAFLSGIPAISIMKITGHRTEKSFMKYIRISQEENANKLIHHPFFA